MVGSNFLSSDVYLLSLLNPTSRPVYSYWRHPACFKKTREPYRAVAMVSSTPPAAVDVESLKKEFRCRGVTFSGISDSYVVTMALENGSMAKLMLPAGLITSYKASMWHGGTVELLHTTVSNGEDGGTLIHGGVSLSFSSFDIHGNSNLSPALDSWVLRKVTGNPQESIQVHLTSKDVQGSMEVEHILTLKGDLMSSEIIIRNLSASSSLRVVGSIMSHLTVSTPEATFICGLEGSDFFTTPPALTDFSLIHPSFGINKQSSLTNSDPGAFPELFSHWSLRNETHNLDGDTKNTMKDAEKMLQVEEEDDDYKNLAQEMSRIYTTAPRSFTIMDRGRRNSLILGRDGFDELYMFSPGSSHDWYGKYAYICVGQAALLQPIILESNTEWRGAQHLFNPNL